MEKLDRLGWAVGMSCSAYGTTFGIRSTDASLADRLVQLLPPETRMNATPVVDRLYSIVAGGPSSSRGVQRLNLIYADAMRFVRESSLNVALRQLESDLHLYVAERARRRVFIHSGAVERDGRVILLPGPTRSGKSTLVAALLKAGCRYYSDEYAVIDPAGRVHPYTRPLQLRDENKTRTIHAPEDFGAATGTDPLKVGLIVFAEYHEGGRWKARNLTPAQAALQLLANTVSARRKPEAALKVLHRITSSARSIKTVRGDVSEAVDRILNVWQNACY